MTSDEIWANEPEHYEIYEEALSQILPGFVRRLVTELRAAGLDAASLYDAAQHPAFTQIGAMSAALGGIDAQILHAIVAFRSYGSRHYSVTKRLFDRLLATHLHGIPGDLVRAPVPAFFVSVPRVLTLHDPQTGEHPWRGFYVTDDPTESPQGIPPSLRVLLVGAPNENSVAPTDDAVFFFRLQKSDIARARDAKELAETLTAPVGTPDPVTFARLPVFIEFVLNCLLYITSETADVAQMFNPEWAALTTKIKSYAARHARPDKIERLVERRRRVPLQERYVLGSRIQRDLLPHGESPVGAGPGHRSPIRHLVTGHWKMQAHGAGRTLRKHLWIEPYWRGSEFAELVHDDPTFADVDEPA